MGVKKKGKEVKKKGLGVKKNRRRLKKKGLGVKKKGYPFGRAIKYVAAVLLAITMLSIVLFVALRLWWRSMQRRGQNFDTCPSSTRKMHTCRCS